LIASYDNEKDVYPDENQLITEDLSVSVIIPAYNSGRFLTEAVESVLGQTYPMELTEIIVVDDGSIDDTPLILERYKSRITCLTQANKGIASARNRGIEAAGGEIITFLDGDDLWREDRLRKTVGSFESGNADIVYHPIALIDSGGYVITENFLRAFGYRERVRGGITGDIMTGKIFCGGSSFAFRRNILKQIFPLPEDVRRGVDYYMTLLASCASAAEYIPEVLGAYRSHKGNISMFAGLGDARGLGVVYEDFSHMRSKVLERLKDCDVMGEMSVRLQL
jgi:glycosyltransferase involved in cell wall biosynthesis